jgi:hypothetical protein
MKHLTGILILLSAWPALVAGQTASAGSYGVSVRTATVNQTSASVTLPSDGSVAQTQATDVTVPSFVSAQDAFATASGATDGTLSDAVSSATLGTVNILNGLITADGVVAMATSTIGNCNGDGSSIGNLVVNGVQLDDPAPNTRVDLPGVGYVVLNEQIAAAGGITVNMIHVVLQQEGLLGTQTVGDIIVGSATSSVN